MKQTTSQVGRGDSTELAEVSRRAFPTTRSPGFSRSASVLSTLNPQPTTTPSSPQPTNSHLRAYPISWLPLGSRCVVVGGPHDGKIADRTANGITVVPLQSPNTQHATHNNRVPYAKKNDLLRLPFNTKILLRIIGNSRGPDMAGNSPSHLPDQRIPQTRNMKPKTDQVGRVTPGSARSFAGPELPAETGPRAPSDILEKHPMKTTLQKFANAPMLAAILIFPAIYGVVWFAGKIFLWAAKRFTLLALLAILYLPSSIFAQSVTPFFLQWDQSVDSFSPDGAWQIYSTTNASAPLSTWPMLTNLYLTNMVNVTNSTSTTNPAFQSFQLQMIPTNNVRSFYAVGYTNFSGVSPFSNVALRPALSQPTNSALRH